MAWKEAGDRVDRAARTNPHWVPWLLEDLRLGGGCIQELSGFNQPSGGI